MTFRIKCHLTPRYLRRLLAANNVKILQNHHNTNNSAASFRLHVCFLECIPVRQFRLVFQINGTGFTIGNFESKAYFPRHLWIPKHVETIWFSYLKWLVVKCLPSINKDPLMTPNFAAKRDLGTKVILTPYQNNLRYKCHLKGWMQYSARVNKLNE